MKNIMMIVPSLKGGGAERVASLLSQELSKKHNLYLVVFDSNDMAYSHGGQLIDIDIKSHGNILVKMINVIRRILKVKKIKKQYNIQSSISFIDSANIINTLSRVNDKVIISIHSHLSKRKKSLGDKIVDYLNKLLYNRADKIVTVSKGIAEDLIAGYNIDEGLVEYIYNPINIKEINLLSSMPVKNKDLFTVEGLNIVNMGRLTNAKGQWHLIRAVSYVKKHIKDINLVIVGQGELEDYLKKLVIDLNLEKNVKFLGYQENPFKFIRLADLFVFSSLYEGFGNVLIEAMACGKPVISTDCRSGPREILAPGTDISYETIELEFKEYGILVPVCDGVYHDSDTPLTREEKLLAKSILDLYENEELRKKYSYRGKDRAKDFDINNIINKWEKLIM